MKILLFLFGMALAAGLYFVLADLLKIPRLATERALISAGRRDRSLVKSLEALILVGQSKPPDLSIWTSISAEGWRASWAPLDWT